MTIHTVSWVRNECDILEAFVRHHAAYGPVTIVLHRCQDNSAEILESLAKEGLPVSWAADERLAHEQAAVLTELACAAFQKGADWVLPLDADEFLIGEVPTVLAAHNDPRLIRVPWKGYVPTSHDDAREPNVLKRITHRRSSESRQWYKVLIPRYEGRTSVQLCLGNHSVIDHEGRRISDIAAPLSLAHFPIRSARQVARKIFGGWLAHCADPLRTPDTCFQWKKVFDTLKNGQQLKQSELTTMAREYATDTEPKTETSIIEDPVPCAFDVRYPIQDIDPMHVLLQNAEEIAVAYAILCRKFQA